MKRITVELTVDQARLVLKLLVMVLLNERECMRITVKNKGRSQRIKVRLAF